MADKIIKKIGVFTSGGDAPGMNAAIRSVVRTASYHDLHIFGIQRGYHGMIEGDIDRLERKDVGNIIHRGGTMLKTARSKEFMTKEGRQQAYENLMAYEIEGLVAIGGNGTYMGANVFFEEFGIPIVGLPGTIDNDIFGTDFSIGFDTSVNTAIDAVDKIRDTADSHNRLFFIEVMGRHSGYIALYTGIGSGAENIIVGGTKKSIDLLIQQLKMEGRRKKLFNLIIVAEGNKNGGAMEISKQVNEALGEDFESRVAIIGHLQRGGSPTGFDRVLASRLGNSAVLGLLEGRKNVAAGLIAGQVVFTDLKDAVSRKNSLDNQLVNLAEMLAM